MKRLAVVALALAFGVAAAPAFAEPVKMSEAQLDQVAGGLADVSVNLTNVGNPTITVSPTTTVSPSISVSVL
jgi:nitrogen fixation/metabolism regulation signal transduction histidine kinase